MTERVQIIFDANGDALSSVVLRATGEVGNLSTALMTLSQRIQTTDFTRPFANTVPAAAQNALNNYGAQVRVLNQAYAESIPIVDRVTAAHMATGVRMVDNKVVGDALTSGIREQASAHSVLGAASTALGTKVKDLAESGFKGLEGAVKGAASGVLSLINPLTSVMGILGIGAGIGAMIGQTEKWTMDVVSMTLAMNGNATAGSTMLAVFDRLGISAPQLISRLDQLARRMDNNSQDFARYGLNVYDAHGKLKDMDAFIPEIMGKLQQLGNTTQGLAAANEFFGRSAGNFAQVFLLAANTWNVLSDAAKKYGLVIGNDALNSQVALAQGMKDLQQQFKGIELAIGTALMPAIVGMGQAFANFVVQNLPAIKSAIAQFVGYVLEAAHILFGFTTQVSDSAKALGQYVAAAGASTDATNNDVAAKTKGSAASKAITEATNDLVQAKEAEIKSLEREKAALDRADEARLRDNNLLIQNLDFTRQQQAEQDKLAALDANQIADTVALKQAAFDGNTTAGAAAQKKITASEAEEAKIQLTIKDNELKNKVKIENDQIRDTKALRDADFTARVQTLQDEVSKIRQAAQDNLQALSASAAGSASAFDINMGKLPGMADKNFSLIDGIAGIKGKSAADSFFGPFEDKNGKIDWDKMGKGIGEAIAKGIGEGFTNMTNNSSFGQGFGTVLQTILTGGIGLAADAVKRVGGPGLVDGGISSGPASGYLQLLHGDEAVLPLNNSARSLEILRQTGLLRAGLAQSSSPSISTGTTTVGGNRTFNVTQYIQGKTDPNEIAQISRDQIAEWAASYA